MTGPINLFIFLLSKGLPILNVPLALGLAVKLVGTGLARYYWPVVAILVAKCIETVLPMKYYGRDNQVLFFQVGHAVMWGFTVLLLWRLTTLVFVNYPSLRDFAVRSIKYLVPLCLIVGLLSFLTDPEPQARRDVVLHASIALNRAVATSVLVFSLALGIFTGWFPVRMSRNTARLLIGFMAVFAAESVGSYVANSEPVATPVSNGVQSLLWTTIIVYWLVTLGHKGEEEVFSPVPAWNPVRLAQTTRQLTQMQADLAKRGL